MYSVITSRKTISALRAFLLISLPHEGPTSSRLTCRTARRLSRRARRALGRTSCCRACRSGRGSIVRSRSSSSCTFAPSQTERLERVAGLLDRQRLSVGTWKTAPPSKSIPRLRPTHGQRAEADDQEDGREREPHLRSADEVDARLAVVQPPERSPLARRRRDGRIGRRLIGRHLPRARRSACPSGLGSMPRPARTPIHRASVRQRLRDQQRHHRSLEEVARRRGRAARTGRGRTRSLARRPP